MEALLSLSFDNISSKDGVKIRKGLRQIEGLLAQICLSQQSASSSPSKRRTSVVPTAPSPAEPKKLDALAEDPAFREFFRLQEGFEWNGKHSAPIGAAMVVAHKTLHSCDAASTVSGALTRHGEQYVQASRTTNEILLLNTIQTTKPTSSSSPPSPSSKASSSCTPPRAQSSPAKSI